MQNPFRCEQGRAVNFTNSRAGAAVQVMTNREGKNVNPIAEMPEMLTGDFFPRNDGDN